MKKIILFFGLLFSFMGASAQATLGEGNLQLNAGLGLSGYGLPVYVGLDYGINEDITVGGELSYRSYSNTWGSERWTHRIIGIFANGNYHFNRVFKLPSEFDLYAGLSLGYFVSSTDSAYKGDGYGGVDYGLQVGGRYFFTKEWAVNLELSGGRAGGAGRIGVTYKF